MSDLSTKMMPVSAARSERRGRLPLGLGGWGQQWGGEGPEFVADQRFHVPGLPCLPPVLNGTLSRLTQDLRSWQAAGMAAIRFGTVSDAPRAQRRVVSPAAW
jgi:hypothetical protein